MAGLDLPAGSPAPATEGEATRRGGSRPLRRQGRDGMLPSGELFHSHNVGKTML